MLGLEAGHPNGSYFALAVLSLLTDFKNELSLFTSFLSLFVPNVLLQEKRI
jgi:hypothetical protein